MLTQLASQQTQTNLGEPILSCLCSEPEGLFERTVYRMPFTHANLLRFYELACKHRVLFTDDIYGDFKTFCELFMSMDVNGNLYGNGIIWVLDDFVGVYYMTHIAPMRDAVVHYTFFDGRFRGRKEITKSMLHYAFNKYQFNRLSTEVGAYANEHVMRYVTSLGFKKEGRKRQAARYKDAWFDVLLYGILKDEVGKWDQKYRKLEADLQQG